MGTSDDKVRAATLRKQAEEKVRLHAGSVPEEFASLPAEDIQTTLHDLQVHQIELEMQNEQLRATQTALDSARARYFDLYDLAPVGYMTITEKGLIAESNLTAAALLAIDRAQLVKQLFSRFILKTNQDIYYLKSKRLFETSIPQSCELKMVKNDDTSFWGRLETTVATDDHGETVCRVVLSDITERMQAEAEREKLNDRLNQMQKLESLGLLAGGIAHDFHNLLGGIFGYIELAREKTTNEIVSTYLDKSLQTMDRARALTQQLLTFGKGGAPIKKVENLFPDVRKIIEFALSGSSVSSRFQIQENLWPCNFDKSQLGQLVDNLTINAFQSMPGGGTIEVAAHNVLLTAGEHLSLAAGKYVKLSIKDQGTGIPKELLSRIFDPYYTTKPSGHGLGLAICYSIASRHGGGLEVESEPGKGSTFHLYLPASPAETVAGIAGKSAESHTGNGTFVVMDDEKVLREIIKLMLESFGYTVVLKANGEDAVNFFMTESKADRKIAGMLFDLTIPGGMGGKEAIEEIRKTASNVPVFVTSGYSEDPVMAEPKKYGFTASIAKPFSMKELADMLEKHIKQP
ncbi:MAG: ATP-binding protein [Desulforhopalus sp.]|nr:ATP-binding protein [Desulforhopalus sp.]